MIRASPGRVGPQSKDLRPTDLDGVDRRILSAAACRCPDDQQRPGRGTRHRRIDLSWPRSSTARRSGVIRGFYADIDPAAVGLPLQAMISVSLQSHARGKIRDFIQQIRHRPQVMDVYFLAGTDDFILHVAARDTEDLRSFVVENLNADADVAGHPDIADLRASARRRTGLTAPYSRYRRYRVCC